MYGLPSCPPPEPSAADRRDNVFIQDILGSTVEESGLFYDATGNGHHSGLFSAVDAGRETIQRQECGIGKFCPLHGTLATTEGSTL